MIDIRNKEKIDNKQLIERCRKDAEQNGALDGTLQAGNIEERGEAQERHNACHALSFISMAVYAVVHEKSSPIYFSSSKTERIVAHLSYLREFRSVKPEAEFDILLDQLLNNVLAAFPTNCPEWINFLYSNWHTIQVFAKRYNCAEGFSHEDYKKICEATEKIKTPANSSAKKPRTINDGFYSDYRNDIQCLISALSSNRQIETSIYYRLYWFLDALRREYLSVSLTDEIDDAFFFLFRILKVGNRKPQMLKELFRSLGLKTTKRITDFVHEQLGVSIDVNFQDQIEVLKAFKSMKRSVNRIVDEASATKKVK